MDTYTLRATYGDKTGTTWIPAEDDDDATFSAMAQILSLAREDVLWAKGRIELRHPDGTVLRVMEEK